MTKKDTMICLKCFSDDVFQRTEPNPRGQSMNDTVFHVSCNTCGNADRNAFAELGLLVKIYREHTHSMELLLKALSQLKENFNRHTNATFPGPSAPPAILEQWPAAKVVELPPEELCAKKIEQMSIEIGLYLRHLDYRTFDVTIREDVLAIMQKYFEDALPGDIVEIRRDFYKISVRLGKRFAGAPDYTLGDCPLVI